MFWLGKLNFFPSQKANKFSSIQGAVADPDDEEEDMDREDEECDWDELIPETASVMKKIQKIVIFYRRSPVKNDVLQKLIKDERGRELKLQKDCKTRWGSVLSMLKNFLKLMVQIQTDLRARGMESLFPSPAEIEHTIELTDALRIIAWAATKLGARDMDLAKADRIFEFSLGELDKLKSTVAKDLRTKLYNRIDERRLKDVATLSGYLHNPKFQFGRKLILSYSNKAEITELAVSIYTRLFHTETNADQGIYGSAKFIYKRTMKYLALRN